MTAAHPCRIWRLEQGSTANHLADPCVDGREPLRFISISIS